MKELNIEAKQENLEIVKAFVNEELEKISCPPEYLIQIDIAVEELFVKIAHYAYDNRIGMATVLIEVFSDPGRVEITLMDKGVPYDPLQHKDPDLSLDTLDRPIGGLGIFIVKESMDYVSY